MSKAKRLGRGGARPGAGRPKGPKPQRPQRKTLAKAIAVQRAFEKEVLSAEAVLEETRLLGFSNMLDYIRIGDDGLPYCDFSKLTR